MKIPDSTEMDRLLHRYARRNSEALRAKLEQNQESRGAGNTVHLDADELNAYAEGALPENARSRYFAHLADCDTCRKLVTDLALSASLADQGKTSVAATDATPAKSWRDWLASLFSPPVLRYGVPALALFAIIVVAIVTMRTQREEPSVAQRDDAARNSVSSATSNSTARTETGVTTVDNHQSSNAAANVPLVEQQSQTKQITPAATPAPAKTAQNEADTPNEPLAEAPKPVAKSTGTSNSDEFGVVDKRPQGAATTTPAPQPPPAADSAAIAGAGNRDRREDQKKAKAIGKDDEGRANTNAAGGSFSTEPEANETRPSAGKIAAQRSIKELPTRRPAPYPKNEDADLAEKEERSAETRSISGHKFRKQGSAWVDTAYKPSQPTTNVARGSEQYRSLVADEPTLRTITQQLGGEVIVVWKSRAYRFY